MIGKNGFFVSSFTNFFYTEKGLGFSNFRNLFSSFWSGEKCPFESPKVGTAAAIFVEEERLDLFEPTEFYFFRRRLF